MSGASRESPRAVVTGGAGFIGSALVDRLLEAGWNVLAVDDLSTGSERNLELASRSAAFSLEIVDIRDARLDEVFLEHRPQVVFHLAAQSSVAISLRDPARDADVNIVGSLRVLDAARNSGARKIVFAASGGTLYGDVDTGRLPADETNPHRPQSPYGLSKKTVVDYLGIYADLFGVEHTCLALANVYGPRQDPHGEAGVVAVFADLMRAGRPCRIDGDGQQTRDFVYVDDVARAFQLAADRGKGALLNIGTGKQVSINELFQSMAEVIGVPVESEHGRGRPSDVRYSALDPRLASTVIGWQPEVDLADGLLRTIRSASD